MVFSGPPRFEKKNWDKNFHNLREGSLGNGLKMEFWDGPLKSGIPDKFGFFPLLISRGKSFLRNPFLDLQKKKKI